MHEAIRTMFQRRSITTADEAVNALREIMQELALLGLWRSKFFERAAFYGGSALRVIHGLPRYSEDLDFSLLSPDAEFTLGAFGESLIREIAGFGFEVDFQYRRERRPSAIESAFLKANTLQQLLLIRAGGAALGGVHPGEVLRITLEVDTDPPSGFQVESRYLLRPIPFSVRVYSLPDLFAGKMHALLCRRWKTRAKGRDWFDLVWYVGSETPLRLAHLEARLRQSGDYAPRQALDGETLHGMLTEVVSGLDVGQARQEASRFVQDQASLEVWSADFFLDIAARVRTV